MAKRMRVLSTLIALFFIIPSLEIWLFIKIGQAIGAAWTIIFTAFTAILGAALVKLQGASTFLRIRRALMQGDIPALEMFAGVMLFFAGALLITPGFFTDIVGFTLLVPPMRRALAKRWFERHAVKINMSHTNPQQQTRVIEVKEFYHE